MKTWDIPLKKRIQEFNQEVYSNTLDVRSISFVNELPRSDKEDIKLPNCASHLSNTLHTRDWRNMTTSCPSYQSPSLSPIKKRIHKERNSENSDKMKLNLSKVFRAINSPQNSERSLIDPETQPMHLRKQFQHRALHKPLPFVSNSPLRSMVLKGAGAGQINLQGKTKEMLRRRREPRTRDMSSMANMPQSGMNTRPESRDSISQGSLLKPIYNFNKI